MEHIKDILPRVLEEIKKTQEQRKEVKTNDKSR